MQLPPLTARAVNALTAAAGDAALVAPGAARALALALVTGDDNGAGAAAAELAYVIGTDDTAEAVRTMVEQLQHEDLDAAHQVLALLRSMRPRRFGRSRLRSRITRA